MWLDSTRGAPESNSRSTQGLLPSSGSHGSLDGAGIWRSGYNRKQCRSLLLWGRQRDARRSSCAELTREGHKHLRYTRVVPRAAGDCASSERGAAERQATISTDVQKVDTKNSAETSMQAREYGRWSSTLPEARHPPDL
jgi:hypothetical protein